jgi:hypothetical protein
MSKKCCTFARSLILETMNRVSFIVLYLFCVRVLCAQTSLVLPYDATALTDEQKASNPERLAYPTELKETIKNEVNFECNMVIRAFGPFSVSAFNMVYFSPGNLQFNAMLGTHQCKDGTSQKGTWRFAEHQWDFVGYSEIGTVYEGGTKCDNSKINANYNGWIDLFGWGTSGWDSGANAYKPYATNEATSDYYPGGNSNNNLTGVCANADWGVYNQIGNVSPGTWRTLTNDEWIYLLYERMDAESLSGLGMVNGVAGLILLPDQFFSVPVGITFKKGAGDGYATNKYTAEQWAKLEEKGAVFLPAACLRAGTTVEEGTGYGAYWSASRNTSNKNNAWYLAFMSEMIGTGNIGRHMGLSVRLVLEMGFVPVPTELKKK